MSIPDDAYSFAVKQIKKRRSLRAEPWSPCLMVDLARAAGIEFQDSRQWGHIFRQLQKDGYIKRAGLFSRASSNGSVRPGWVGL